MVDSTQGKITGATRPAISDESIRLAAKLRAAFPQGPSVLQFTGVSQREGVSHVAGQVACALAHMDQTPVLLLDGNLRSPAVHDAFHVSLKPGLSNLILSEASIRDVIRPTDVTGLSVLPAGSSVADSVQLFSSAAWNDLMRTVREKFRFVIVDSPPVLRFVDSTLLAPQCDGVIIVVAAGRRRRADLAEAQRLLQGLKANLVGVVLAGTEPLAPPPHSNGHLR